jgi:hypothetical protein
MTEDRSEDRTMPEETRISVNPLSKEEARISLDCEPKKEAREKQVLRKVYPGFHVLPHVLIASLVGFLLLILSVAGILAFRKEVFEANIRKIKVGDTKERVLELLGEPQARFAKGGQLPDVLRKEALRQKKFLLWLNLLLLGESPETWVYGYWKILRLGLEVEDYGIEFDANGRVSRVVFPTKPDS